MRSPPGLPCAASHNRSHYRQRVLGPGQLVRELYLAGWQMAALKGETLVGLLKANLNGHPEAARNWMRTVFGWIQKHFNTNGWQAKQSHTDQYKRVQN